MADGPTLSTKVNRGVAWAAGAQSVIAIADLISQMVVVALFVSNADYGVADVLSGMGLDGTALIAQAQTDDGKTALRAQSGEAQRRKVFGAPTFFAGPEMFWGNDRLEDALDWAAGSR